ncbi:unnamed protein product [Larinioides sclopetarius]|uniref:Uncharacterized protein n=1 Tax=Larinioides sclopetarius TaxID=280406 RepID=A0AAV2AXB5_9ARAC
MQNNMKRSTVFSSLAAFQVFILLLLILLSVTLPTSEAKPGLCSDICNKMCTGDYCTSICTFYC